MKDIISYVTNPLFRTWWLFLITAALSFALWAAFGSSPVWLWVSTAGIMGIWVGILFIVLVKRIRTENLMASERGLILRVINHLTEAVVVYDENLTVTLFNNPAEKLFGVARNLVESKKFSPSLVKDEQFKSITQVLFPSLAPAATQVSEPGSWPNIIRIGLENPHREFLVTTDLLSNGSFIKTIKDETLERENSKTKEDFISVAAHQLRTPLTAIHWAIEGIIQSAKEAGNANILSIAQEVLGVSERSLKISNDLLDAAKVEDGRYTTNPEKFDVGKLVERVVGELRPIAERYEIEISANVPSALIFADQNGIGMALLNFIDNAIRYNTPHGKVGVVGVKDGDSIKITVSDTGVGIPPEDLEKVFEKLHRGSNVVQMQPNGSGLGMYIAKNIVEKNGGSVGVESRVKRGTSVWIKVPLVK